MPVAYFNNGQIEFKDSVYSAPQLFNKEDNDITKKLAEKVFEKIGHGAKEVYFSDVIKKF